MSRDIDLFISKFCNWGYQKGCSTKLPSFLRRVIDKELPKWDKKLHVHIRDLTNSQNLMYSILAKNACCGRNPENYLMTAVCFPYWREGFKYLSTGDYVLSIVEGFFHFASQYVARSRVLDIIGSIALTYGRGCDFNGKTYKQISLENTSETIEKFHKDFYLFNEFISSSNRHRKQANVWLDVINCLDPFIHRLLFNYVRAIQLFEHDFYEEGITALDKTVNVAEQYLRERLKLTGKNQRDVLISTFGFGKQEEKDLKQLYELRCFFGAHPSMSKWWDFTELYEEPIETVKVVVKKVIYKMCCLERENRVVESDPEQWSSWFMGNAMMLWNSVWFDKLPF